jgi:hypothetical protein
MPDYKHLRECCENVREVSTRLIEDFLLYYSATWDKTDREFDNRFSRFKDIEMGMPSNWKKLIKAQYIAHRIFRSGGLITKYLNHSAIKNLTIDEQHFLRLMASNPWKFSFSEIRANPEPDFYEMEDVFTGEVYLLYSQSMSQILEENQVLIWFNLISFNGSCWQTYGPIINFKCFNADDIFFYATEINPAIDSDAALVKDLDEHPIRYMMLITGANYPLIQSRGYEVVQATSEIHTEKLDVQELKKNFKVEYSASVFRLSHKEWSEPPHFAEVYYGEQSGKLFLSALTDAGYLQLSRILNGFGINFPADPDIRVHLPMLTVIEKLFKRRPDLNPYAKLFEIKPTVESEEMTAKLNKFLSLVLPYVNAGEEPDLDLLAKEANVSTAEARDLLQQSRAIVKSMRR